MNRNGGFRCHTGTRFFMRTRFSRKPCVASVAIRWGRLAHMSDSEHSDWQKTTIDSAQAEQHPETARAVAKIKALRQSIDNIDSAIVSLLAERFKATSQVGVLKANAGFAPEDTKREDYQIERLHRIAVDAGLICKSRRCTASSWSLRPKTPSAHRRSRGDPGVLDVFA